MLSYLTYGFFWLISYIPLRILYILSDILYYILYYVIGYRRKVVRQNLQNSFPEKSVTEIISLEKKFYHHLCDLFMESYKFWHMSEKQIRKRCEFKNLHIPQKYYDEGKSVIGVLGHYGNWEWMASYPLWNHSVDFPVLYKPLRNKVMDKMMLKVRSHFGATPIPKNDILRYIINSRKEGKIFLAGFIADQTPNWRNLNFWMNFLNQDTPVFFGTEKIATKFNLPVVSVHMTKIKRGYYQVEFVDLCAEPAKLSYGELTEMHMRCLENYIKEAPEYWLWSHKRWKHKKPENHENTLLNE